VLAVLLILSLEWKTEGVIKMARAKVVTVMRWYAQDEVNQEESEQNESDGMKEGSWLHRWGDAYLKEQSVICNEEDTNGRARVTRDEERGSVCSQVGW